MNDLQTHVTDYLDYCQNQKRLDAKTLRAYRIDLSQFCTGLFCASSKSIADTNAACHCIFVSSIVFSIPAHPVNPARCKSAL